MQPAEPSDEALMRAYAAGDEAAFERLLRRHEAALWRFVRRRLGSLHEGATEDVLQDTWISVARAAPRYEAQAEARFATWLYTVARSRVIDHLRRQDAPAVSLDETGGDDDGAALGERLAADARDEPLARVTSRRQAEAFMQALDALPAEQREAFVLQAEGGLSVEEIGSVCGVGSETAKSRLRYARTKLRDLLAAWSTP